jgi:hypothetical protein
MLYIVSDSTTQTALKDFNLCDVFGTLQDAQIVATKTANRTGLTQYVYLIETVKVIEPENTFRLEFHRLESDVVDIQARDLAEAINKARDQFPKNEWDLIRSQLIEKE